MSEEMAVGAFKKMLSNFTRDEKNRKRFSSWNKSMAVTFNDLNKTFVSQVVGGIPGEPELKQIEQADIWIKIDAPTWIGIMKGEVSGMKAYTSGKLKIKGAMTDLLKLQKLMGGESDVPT